MESDPATKLNFAEFDSAKGREIRGLHPVDERFSLLTEGTDYTMDRINKALRIVTPGRQLQDFVFFINPGEGEIEKTIEAPHWRTVTDACDTVLSYEVQTEDGFEFHKTPFYEMNTKGIGYTKPAIKGRDLRDADHFRVQKAVLYGERQLGMASKDDFSPKGEGDIILTANYLIANGVRTEGYAAVETLRRVYFRNKLYTIAELKKMGVIVPHTRFQPQIAQRVVKCNVRVEEIKEHGPDHARHLFERGYYNFCREHGTTSKEDMVRMSCEYLAKSMASLINVGFIHGYLHSSNVSIVGEVLDLGTCVYHENCPEKEWTADANGMRAGHYKDMRDVLTSASYYLESYENLFGESLDRKALAAAMIQTFTEMLNDQSTKHGTDKARAVEIFSTLCTIIVGEGRSVPSFKKSKAVLRP